MPNHSSNQSFHPKRILLSLVLFLFSAPALGEPSYITFPSNIDWVTRTSANFQILYRKGQHELAEKTIRAAEKSHRLLASIFPETPPKTWIVLADFSDSTNGYALNFPFPHMVIFAAPPGASGTLANLDDWLESVVLHEYVHILHLYPAHGLWAPLRSIFGTIIVPNGLMPSHLHEGAAVLLETELTDGGRGRSALWSMYRRKAVEAGEWGGKFVPIDLLDGSARDWPHGRSAYFFGYYFYKELWDNFGRKGLNRLTLAASSNWPYFVESPFSETFGMDYTTIWRKTFESGRIAAKKEIQQIQQTPLSSLRYLTKSRFSKWDLQISPDNKWLAFRSGSPNERASIKIMDATSGQLKTSLETTPQGEGICWGTYQGKSQLIFTERKSENGYRKGVLAGAAWSDSELNKLSIRGIHPQRLHQVACSADLQKIWAYQEAGGKGQLVQYHRSGPHSEIRIKKGKSWALPLGSWISSIVVGRKTWFAVREGTRTRLYRWENSGPIAVATYPGHIQGLRIDRGNRLVGIWDRDNRYEAWEFDPQSGQARKAIGVMGGLISVVPRPGQWLVASYEHGGYDIATTTPRFSSAISPPSVPRSKPRQVAAVPLSQEEDYSAWSSLAPRTWIPNLLLVPDGAQISAYIPGFDVSQRHFYDGIFGYDTRGSAFGSLGYRYRFRDVSSLGGSAYFSPSYIVSSKLFLTRWGTQASFSTRFGDWTPNYTFSAMFNKLESSPGISGTPRRNVGLGVSVSYALDNVEVHPMEVTPRWGTVLSGTYNHFLKAIGSQDNYFSLVAGVDQYLPAPWWKGHGFFLRTRAGLTQGTSLVNSFFEGGGELPFSQGRTLFQNRGFLPGTFFARRIFNASLEYRFPLFQVYRGVDTLPFFLERLHMALVADVSTSDYGARYSGDSATLNSARRHLFKVFYGSYGLELKSNTRVGFYLPMGIRLGLYRGVASFDLATGANGTPVSRTPSVPDFYFVLGLDVALL